MKRKHLSYMSTILAAFMLLAPSCTDEVSYDYEGESSYNKEEGELTFSISAADLGVIARSADDPKGPGSHQTVAKGEFVDMLIYSVYIETNLKVKDPVTGLDTDEEVKDPATGRPIPVYTLLYQYGHDKVGIISKNPTNPNENIDWTGTNVPADFLASKGMTGVTPDAGNRRGQSIIYLEEGYLKEGKDVKISLRVQKNQSYVFVFWAQSSKTDAYEMEIEGLRTVKVSYKDAKNNDEYRDAFYKSDHLSVGSQQLNTTRSVTLTRPFAQINVGTTGADFANMVAGEHVYTNKVYAYSRMKVSGLANQIDLIKNEISGNEADDVLFDWAPFPAYINGYVEGSNDEDQLQEFLYVDLNNDGKFTPYTESYPDGGGVIDTETFKYLSMSYVLVPTSQPNASDPNDYASVLPKVGMAFAETEDGCNYVKENDGTNTKQPVKGDIEVTFIPVQRNWRTNILGGLGTISSPKSIFSVLTVEPVISSDFIGDNIKEME